MSTDGGHSTQTDSESRREPAARGGPSFQLPSGFRNKILPFVSVVVLVVFFGVLEPRFFTISNFTIVASQAAPLLFITLGATFVVLMGGIDLSVGSAATLASALAAVLVRDYDIGYLAMPVAIAVGIAAGLVNGLITTYFRLPSFLVTLGTLSIFGGLSLHLLQGRSVPVGNPPFRQLAIGQLIPNLPNAMLFALSSSAVLIFVGSWTRFGRYIAAIGAGEAVATVAGIRVRRYKIYAFTVSGAFAGVGGAFILARLGSGSPQVGANFLLDSIAAIVVGGTALSGGVGGVHRTLLGVAIISILSNGLGIMGVGSFTRMMIIGCVVILAVATTIDRERMMNVVK